MLASDATRIVLQQMSHDGEPLIDLHGQHAAEGVATLRRELARLRASQPQPPPTAAKAGVAQRTVYVLVGTGHHTKVCAPRTAPLLLRCLPFGLPCGCFCSRSKHQLTQPFCRLRLPHTLSLRAKLDQHQHYTRAQSHRMHQV